MHNGRCRIESPARVLTSRAPVGADAIDGAQSLSRQQRDGAPNARARLVAHRRSVRSNGGRSRCARRVSTCLDCAFPIVLWWGPELTILYNDEYVPMLGPAKHPRGARAARAPRCGRRSGTSSSPMLSQVMSHGRADAVARPAAAHRPRLPRRSVLLVLVQPDSRRRRDGRRRLLPGHRNHGEGHRRAPPAHAARSGRPHQRRRRARTTPTPRRRRRWPRTRTTSRSRCIYRVDDARTAAPARGRGRHRAGRAAVARTGDARRPGDAWSMQRVAGSGRAALLTDLARALRRAADRRLEGGAAQRARAAGAAARPGAAARHPGGGGEPDARARRRLPHVLRAGRHARLPPVSPTRRRSRRSGGAPRAWPSSIAPRPRSSPTSRTSSARR